MKTYITSQEISLPEYEGFLQDEPKDMDSKKEE